MFTVKTDGLIPVYTTSLWPSLWHGNSITLGRNSIIWLHACLEQDLYSAYRRQLCPGCSCEGSGPGPPHRDSTAPPATFSLPQRAMGWLQCLATASPQVAESSAEGRGHTEQTKRVVFRWRRSQMAAGSVLSGVFTWRPWAGARLDHPVRQVSAWPTWHSLGEAALLLLSPRGLVQSTGTFRKAKYYLALLSIKQCS